MFGKFEQKKSTLSVLLKFGTEANSDIPNSIVPFTFFALDEKHPFWPHLVQNIKIIIFSWKLAPNFLEYAKFICGFHNFSFTPEKVFLGKFCPKTHFCQFKQKFVS